MIEDYSRAQKHVISAYVNQRKFDCLKDFFYAKDFFLDEVTKQFFPCRKIFFLCTLDFLLQEKNLVLKSALTWRMRFRYS